MAGDLSSVTVLSSLAHLGWGAEVLRGIFVLCLAFIHKINLDSNMPVRYKVHFRLCRSSVKQLMVGKGQF